MRANGKYFILFKVLYYCIKLSGDQGDILWPDGLSSCLTQMRVELRASYVSLSGSVSKN